MKKHLLLLASIAFVSYIAAQNVGIGTTTPLARLHVADSSVVFSATGAVSLPTADPPVSGAGRRMLWYANKAAFRAGYVQNNEWDNDNTGPFSFATGYNTKAIGFNSFAAGNTTFAAANYTTALGFETIASGEYSTAIGGYTKASGVISTATGYGNIAKGFATTVVGMFNDSILPADQTSPLLTTPLFIVGNGSADFLRSNALTILKNGHTGIGTSLPLARLHVADSSVVFSASGDILVSPGNPPVSGGGKRMLWYPDKASFRAGYIDGGQWDKDSIGLYSVAMGYKTKAYGPASIAIGNKSLALHQNAVALGADNIASGIQSLAMGNYTQATGEYATSMGYFTMASGDFSTAVGANNIASGIAATAMGQSTTAASIAATAMGQSTAATAWASTAMGLDTRAKSVATTVIGKYNDSTATNSLFEIGNGFNNINRKNAVTVLANGRVGIGLVVPLARLHVTDSSVVFSAAGTSLFPPGDPPMSGIGRRMMWYADKGAFRAGFVSNTQWDKDSIGTYSFAAGHNNKAKGIASSALGGSNTASGENSFVVGINNRATNQNSIAIGETNQANAMTAVAIGGGNFATADYAIAIGYNTSASGAYSLTLGVNSIADGYISTALGHASKPRGAYTIAAGESAEANAWASTAMGRHNDPIVPVSGSWVLTEPLFIIGNGTDINDKKNALTILKNGNVGLQNNNTPNAPLAFASTTGTKISLYESAGNAHYGLAVQGFQLQMYSDNPSARISFGYYTGGTFTERMYLNNSTGVLTVNGTNYPSDARLKENIIPLENSLQKIIQLGGYHYYWKDKKNNDQLQTGVLAQEVQKLFPELVTENKEGILAVNYSGLIPVLIESVKEQQKQIDELKKLLQQLLNK